MGTGLVKLNAIDRYRGRGILFIVGRVRVRIQGCLIVYRSAIPCLCHRGVVGDGVLVFINTIFVLGKGNICYFAASIPVDLCASTGLNGHSPSIICHAKHLVGELCPNKVLLVAVHCDRPLDIPRLVRSNRAALIDSIAEILADGNGLFSAVFYSLTLIRIRGTHVDRIIGGNRGLRLIRNGIGIGNFVYLTDDIGGIVAVWLCCQRRQRHIQHSGIIIRRNISNGYPVILIGIPPAIIPDLIIGNCRSFFNGNGGLAQGQSLQNRHVIGKRYGIRRSLGGADINRIDQLIAVLHPASLFADINIVALR